MTEVNEIQKPNILLAATIQWHGTLPWNFNQDHYKGNSIGA